MPVTIKPAATAPTLIKYDTVRPADHSREVLRYACEEDQRKCLELLQSSFDVNLAPALLPAPNGFVNSAIQAYSRHHHLIIRPEDIWNAVLVQLSFYINAHAEELRGHFVAHEGKKELKVVYQSGDRYTVDFGDFADQISHLIEGNVVDLELRGWMMPAFSTTTKHDIVVASIVMMGSMKNYFSYECMICCGLPSVTLQGVKADYELISKRLEKLCSYGAEPTEFCKLLRPVIKRFVQSFETPESHETKDFWGRIFKEENRGSGPTWYSGWITAFCFWDEQGQHLTRHWPEFADVPSEGIYSPAAGIDSSDSYLFMDGVRYPNITDDEVPAGFCKVPVKIDDNGDVFDAEMIAGSVGMNCTSSGNETEGGVVGLDTLQPQTGWWIYEKISIRGA